MCQRREEKSKVAFPDGKYEGPADPDDVAEQLRTEEKYQQRLLAPNSPL